MSTADRRRARRPWTLERVLFALAGTVTLASVALGGAGEPVVPAADRPSWASASGPTSWSATARPRWSCAASPSLQRVRPMSALGPIGRLGRWSAAHAPRRVHRLGGRRSSASASSRRGSRPRSRAPGWEDSGSESVQARDLIQENFAGNASVRADGRRPLADASRPPTRRSPTTIARAETLLRADARVASVTPPRQGQTISADGHTAIVMAGSAEDPMRMVRAADDLKGAARRPRGRRPAAST